MVDHFLESVRGRALLVNSTIGQTHNNSPIRPMNPRSSRAVQIEDDCNVKYCECREAALHAIIPQLTVEPEELRTVDSNKCSTSPAPGPARKAPRTLIQACQKIQVDAASIS